MSYGCIAIATCQLLNAFTLPSLLLLKAIFSSSMFPSFQVAVPIFYAIGMKAASSKQWISYCLILTFVIISVLFAWLLFNTNCSIEKFYRVTAPTSHTKCELMTLHNIKFFRIIKIVSSKSYKPINTMSFRHYSYIGLFYFSTFFLASRINSPVKEVKSLIADIEKSIAVLFSTFLFVEGIATITIWIAYQANSRYSSLASQANKNSICLLIRAFFIISSTNQAYCRIISNFFLLLFRNKFFL